VLLTVSLNDLRNEKFSLEENSFTFAGESGPEKTLYKVNLTFYNDVIPQVRSNANHAHA